VVLPLFLAVAFTLVLLLPPQADYPRFRRGMHGAVGAIAGLTVTAGALLLSLFLEGQVSLLAFIAVFFWVASLLGALVGAGLGWLIWKARA
jgi:hypothetical protein